MAAGAEVMEAVEERPEVEAHRAEEVQLAGAAEAAPAELQAGQAAQAAPEEEAVWATTRIRTGQIRLGTPSRT